jgi:hypothetical protein
VKYAIGAQAKGQREAMTRDLLSETEQDGLRRRVPARVALRGDTAARAAFYKALPRSRRSRRTRIRERENLNPLPGGDDVVKNVPKSPAPSNAARSEGRPTGASAARAPDHARGRRARRAEGTDRGAQSGDEAFASDPTAGRNGAVSSTTITPDSSATS